MPFYKKSFYDTISLIDIDITKTMHYNDIIKLLNLEYENINFHKFDVTKKDNVTTVYIELEKTDHSCPNCGSISVISHGFKEKIIKHSIVNYGPFIIKYKARRYICKDCKSTFFETSPFTFNTNNISKYTEMKVLEYLKSHTSTFTNVAKELNISITSVMKIFDDLVFTAPVPYSEAICIDEIYTNRLTKRKYCCVIMDFFSKKIVEIYPSRLKLDLINNLDRLPKKERNIVKYVTIDMYEPYKQVAKLMFDDCIIAIDSFHVMKHLNDAMDIMRLKVMRRFDNGHAKLENANMYYYMLKKFHYFFTKNYDNIYEGKINIGKMKCKWYKDDIRKYLLDIDEELKMAYQLKTDYQEFNYTAKFETCDEELNELIDRFRSFSDESFRTFGRLLYHWREEIKNSFRIVNGRRLSNGAIENLNSRLKCIIKNANGYRNFERFRKRCIYSINKELIIKN